MKRIRNIILLIILTLFYIGINAESVSAKEPEIESEKNYALYNTHLTNVLANKRFVPVNESDGGGSGDSPKECSALLDDELIDWINTAFLIVQIGAVVVVAVLGMIDFVKAAIVSDDDSIRKTWSKFIKRVVALIILLILPQFIEFILSLIDVPGLTEANPLCK